jgi:hypothetical protein
MILLIIVIQMYFINAKLPVFRVCGDIRRENDSLRRHCRSASDLQQGCSRSKHSGNPALNRAPMAMIKEGPGFPDPFSGGAGSPYAYLTSEVQWPQRAALMEMVERQMEHSLVVGAAAACRRWKRFARRTTRKMTKDTIRKSITVLMTRPYLMMGALTAASDPPAPAQPGTRHAGPGLRGHDEPRDTPVTARLGQA